MPESPIRRHRPRSLKSPSLKSWSLKSLALLSLGVVAGATIGCVPEMPPDPQEPPAEASAVPAPDAAPEAAAPAVEQPRRAEVGVGRQGRSLDDETGVGRVIAQPAVSLFAVRERAVFDIQIPKAMQLFEATEGRKPKSHEEFMQRIIAANQIQLPELPTGSEYRYEPDKGELWVHPT
ncbi:hypothetical protein [Candidatus Laterigemmans baculatus]|uniref:hypothetical protein n=1 Tax=Candidatus Laterigemmans baculatus TaxID=2770505 RepID=UPI0013D9F7B2|nr:hypothetical protein [Candidatus Laterigemmans baculatus]